MGPDDLRRQVALETFSAGIPQGRPLRNVVMLVAGRPKRCRRQTFRPEEANTPGIPSGVEIALPTGMVPSRLIFAVFLVLQVADGLITYAAVSIFGGAAEGNPLLAASMEVAGAGPTLFVAKLLACGCGTLLYALRIHRTLAALTGLYGVGAIGPWLHVLSA